MSPECSDIKPNVVIAKFLLGLNKYMYNKGSWEVQLSERDECGHTENGLNYPEGHEWIPFNPVAF